MKEITVETEKDNKNNITEAQPTNTDADSPHEPAALAAEKADDTDTDYSYPLSYYREDEFERRDYQRQKEQAEQDKSSYYRSYQPPPPPPQQAFREIPQTEGFSIAALTEAAMMIAVSLVLSVVSLYVPILSFIGSLLFPVPIAMLVLRRGIKVGFTGAAALLILSSMFFGWLQALLLLVQYGAVGLLLGYSFRKNRSPISTLAIAVVIAAVGTLLDLMLSVFVSGLDVADLLAEVDLIVNEYLEAIRSQGLAESLLASGMTLEQYGDILRNQMRKLLPGALILSSMLMTAVLYIVSSKILRRLRYDVPLLPKFTLWRMDWRLVWGIILGLAMHFAGAKLAVDWLNTLGVNLLYVFCPLMAICGVSFAIWYCKHSQMSYPFKVLLVLILIIYFRFIVYILVLLGVIDSVYDLRPRVERRIEQRQQKRDDGNLF